MLKLSFFFSFFCFYVMLLAIKSFSSQKSQCCDKPRMIARLLVAYHRPGGLMLAHRLYFSWFRYLQENETPPTCLR